MFQDQGQCHQVSNLLKTFMLRYNTHDSKVIVFTKNHTGNNANDDETKNNMFQLGGGGRHKKHYLENN